MSTTTAKGVPKPELTDAPNVPRDVGAVADWIDARPGIAPLTYAQISALSGADLWTGRVVFQTDTGSSRPIVGPYEYVGANWVPVGSGFLPQFAFLRQVGTATYTVNTDNTFTGFGASGWTLSVDIPTGATQAFIRTSIEGVYEGFAAGAASFQFRTVLDSNNGPGSGYFSGPDNLRQYWAWATHFTGLTAGTGKSITIEGRRVGGDTSTVLHADTNSYLTHDIRFA